ncbi:MAG: hypothetical protein HY912_04190 [Desulfomonile tiedjei]|uniref:Uncharacterized protein n=1 Tax=Desulfomonile tiedjei TaxID=2358 RepID=A0A9D6UZQ9_9BACT|nr:hypothetical protein [Desulfomonile tiedjei]
MPAFLQSFRFPPRITLWFLVIGLLAGCFSARGLTEIQSSPYTGTYEDDSTARFSNPDDSVFFEVRRTKVSRPLENLAVHYAALFPGGEVIRPGDAEEYTKIDGKNAYKVVFKTNYIRNRKRVDPKRIDEPVSPGWTKVSIEDPDTGKQIPVLYGPVIPRQRVLYLVEGDSYIYYIVMRADGDAIESVRKRFEDFVRKDIKYK